MAGDWIKMRTTIRRNPKTLMMANHLSVNRNFMNWWSDPVQRTCNDSVTEIVTFSNVARVTVCGLLEVWGSLNESLNSDGFVRGMSLLTLDDMAEIPGFGEAMEFVGWVEETPEGLVFPNFSEHNVPEKERPKAKSNAERQAEYRERQKAKKEESNESNESNGREEKRRIKKNNKRKVTLPDDFDVSERVQRWADEKGYSRLGEHLENFKLAAESKSYTYADWDSAFMRAVRENWAKLPVDGYQGQSL